MPWRPGRSLSRSGRIATQGRPGLVGGDAERPGLLLAADSKPALWAMLEAVQAQVTALRLRLHPAPRLAPRGEGLTWVGYRVLPDRVRLAAANPHRFRRRLRGLVRACRAGELPREAFGAHWAGWSGHAGHANAAVLRREVRWRAMT